MSTEKREKIVLRTWIAIIAFVFSALGTILANTFMAGKLVQKVDTLEKQVTQHIEKADKYVLKETFTEYKQNEVNQFKSIDDNLKWIRQYITTHSIK